MLKLWVKNTLLFFVVIAISTFAGWCAYTVTRNNQEDYAAQVSAAGARQSDEKMEPQAEGASAAFECYTVRLEGEKICVYAQKADREEFLYSVDIYRPDLSEGDKTLLESGVILKSSSALTAFMENYTS